MTKITDMDSSLLRNMSGLLVSPSALEQNVLCEHGCRNCNECAHQPTALKRKSIDVVGRLPRLNRGRQQPFSALRQERFSRNADCLSKSVRKLGMCVT